MNREPRGSDDVRRISSKISLEVGFGFILSYDISGFIRFTGINLVSFVLLYPVSFVSMDYSGFGPNRRKPDLNPKVEYRF